MLHGREGGAFGSVLYVYIYRNILPNNINFYACIYNSPFLSTFHACIYPYLSLSVPSTAPSDFRLSKNHESIYMYMYVQTCWKTEIITV